MSLREENVGSGSLEYKAKEIGLSGEGDWLQGEQRTW